MVKIKFPNAAYVQYMYTLLCVCTHDFVHHGYESFVLSAILFITLFTPLLITKLYCYFIHLFTFLLLLFFLKTLSYGTMSFMNHVSLCRLLRAD